jgi:hypothetical protein
VRLSLDTSILGALTDLGDERRLGLTRGLLQRFSEGTDVGVISNVVQGSSSAPRRIFDRGFSKESEDWSSTWSRRTSRAEGFSRP